MEGKNKLAGARAIPNKVLKNHVSRTLVNNSYKISDPISWRFRMATEFNSAKEENSPVV